MEQFMHLLQNSGSPYHVVETCERQLKEAGFEETDWHHLIVPQPGGKYYLKPYKSMLVAFTMGTERIFFQNIRIAGAHTDQPCFKVKPNPEMKEQGYLKVNVEPYGGLMLATWMDRPLALAGKVVLRSDKVFEPKIVLFDSERPIGIIPNLAIHINREYNNGMKLSKQKDMTPVLGLLSEKWNENDFFLSYLAKELQVEKEDILDFDLFFYNADEPELIGLDHEFISSSRLDNLASCQALVDGIINGYRTSGMNMIVLYDNEEIGSGSKQGAGSNLLETVIRGILSSLGQLESQYVQTLAHSMYLSMDAAQGLHPNYPEKADPTNKAVLGNGVIIKINANQRYATDAETTGVMKQLLDKWNIPYQMGVNHSDVPCGTTIGPIMSGNLPIRGIDMGLPLLAMHSAREMAAAADYMALKNTVHAFFSEN